MLKGQIKGINNSWAVRWYAAAFLVNKLTLYPNKTLIYNIGFDGTGVHSGSVNVFSNALTNKTNHSKKNNY